MLWAVNSSPAAPVWLNLLGYQMKAYIVFTYFELQEK